MSSGSPWRVWGCQLDACIWLEPQSWTPCGWAERAHLKHKAKSKAIWDACRFLNDLFRFDKQAQKTNILIRQTSESEAQQILAMETSRRYNDSKLRGMGVQELIRDFCLSEGDMGCKTGQASGNGEGVLWLFCCTRSVWGRSCKHRSTGLALQCLRHLELFAYI